MIARVRTESALRRAGSRTGPDRVRKAQQAGGVEGSDRRVALVALIARDRARGNPRKDIRRAPSSSVSSGRGVGREGGREGERAQRAH